MQSGPISLDQVFPKPCLADPGQWALARPWFAACSPTRRSKALSSMWASGGRPPIGSAVMKPDQALASEAQTGAVATDAQWISRRQPVLATLQIIHSSAAFSGELSLRSAHSSADAQ